MAHGLVRMSFDRYKQQIIIRKLCPETFKAVDETAGAGCIFEDRRYYTRLAHKSSTNERAPFVCAVQHSGL